MAHDKGSFDYKIINKNIQKILDNRSLLDNTVQVAMPFVKATTTINPSMLGAEYDGCIGFTLGLHAINEDVKYEDIYTNQSGDLPLVGYTYTTKGKNKRVYAQNIDDEVSRTVAAVFDRSGKLFDNTQNFVRIPPPGITQVTIGRAKNGLLASAQLEISVPSLIQLESLHKTFLVPGLGMILEWGQQFAVESLTTDVTGELPDISYGMFPWHDRNKTLEIFNNLAVNKIGLQNILNEYVYPTSGQYMWMFGRVANFSINATSDGSFNCTVKIVGPSEDAWSYSTTNTVVPAKDPSVQLLCADTANSVYSYFTETVTGALNLKSLLDDIKNPSKNSPWQKHVIFFSQGNKQEGEPKENDKTPNVNSKLFADSEDAYFMSWRFFVNVVLNDEDRGLKAIFKKASLTEDERSKIGTLLPYLTGQTRETSFSTPGKAYINDPFECFVGLNKYLRSVDPSVLIIVNERAVYNAANNPQYNIQGSTDKFLKPTENSNKFSSIGWFDKSAESAPNQETAYITNPNEPDCGFLSSGVWVNHKAVCEAMISGDTILRGIVNLLERMNQATSNYWQLTIDSGEPDPDSKHSHNYMVVDANWRISADKAVSKFLDNVHLFNKYVRINSDGKLVGSELFESSVDLSLPKRLFSQIATMGLVQTEDLQKAGVDTGETNPIKSPKLSDPNDTLRELFAITVLTPKSDARGPDLTILPKTERAELLAVNGQCGHGNVQLTAQTAGVGNRATSQIVEQDLKNKNTDELKKLRDSAEKELASDKCKECEKCTDSSPQTSSPTSEQTTSTSNQTILPSDTSKYIDKNPWSAGFISYAITNAGISFPSAAAHTLYSQRIRTGFTGWEALNPSDTRVKIGDIIVQNRSGNTLKFNTNPWAGPSHGDIVTSIRGNRVIAIGGNVASTVYSSTFNINENGILVKDGFFVILRPSQSSVTAIVNSANSEYQKWSVPKWKEQTPAAFDSLSTYYKAGNVPGADRLQGPITVKQTVTNQGGANCIKLLNVREREICQKAVANGITKTEELAQFIAQSGHESLSFTKLVEQASGRAYENRKDLGNINPGDGPRYKGRGYLQLTGRTNYRSAGRAIGVDLENNPERVAEPDTALKTSIWYWNQRVRPGMAKGRTSEKYGTWPSNNSFTDTIAVTWLVNGGQNGFSDRESRFKRVYKELTNNAPIPQIQPPTPTVNREICNSKKCEECNKYKEILRQSTVKVAEQEKTDNAVSKATRQFPHLQDTFRYVEVFPEYMVAQITNSADGNFSNSFGASPGTLSIQADLTMPGINGLRVGELFWIDRMPVFYKAFGAFQIMSIEDTIGLDGWKTKIHARFNFLGKKWKEAMARKLTGATR